MKKTTIAAALLIASVAGQVAQGDSASASSFARVKEVLAKVEGRDDCKRMDYFDLAQPLAVTGDTAVALKLKCGIGGDCVIYWRSESMSDFVSDRGVRFSAIGDGELHTYVLRPDWKVSDKLVKLRIPAEAKRSSATAFFRKTAWRSFSGQMS